MQRDTKLGTRVTFVHRVRVNENDEVKSYTGTLKSSRVKSSQVYCLLTTLAERRQFT